MLPIISAKNKEFKKCPEIKDRFKTILEQKELQGKNKNKNKKKIISKYLKISNNNSINLISKKYKL